MEEVCERENLKAALRQVKANEGSPGVNVMSVGGIKDYLKQHWPAIREQLRTERCAISEVSAKSPQSQPLPARALMSGNSVSAFGSASDTRDRENTQKAPVYTRKASIEAGSNSVLGLME
jgi:hypothetical protein